MSRAQPAKFDGLNSHAFLKDALTHPNNRIDELLPVQLGGRDSAAMESFFSTPKLERVGKLQARPHSHRDYRLSSTYGKRRHNTFGTLS